MSASERPRTQELVAQLVRAVEEVGPTGQATALATQLEGQLEEFGCPSYLARAIVDGILYPPEE